MPILASDLKWYGSQSMPDDDTPTNIGGAIDKTKKVEFVDNSGLIQVMSSTTVDTTQIVTVSYRDAAATVIAEAKTLSGQTPVAYSANMERILKAIKNAFTLGDIAIESQVSVRTGTAQAGAADNITLDAGASAVDNFFQAMVIRITAGTGVGQIREIIAYVGATKLAQVSYAWGVIPDATSVFRISNGIVFEKSPNEIISVRRPFFNSTADVPGGLDRDYFEKIFLANAHQTLALTSSQIIEQANPSGLVSFGLPATSADAFGNGAGNNRQVAPGGITFDTSTKNVPGPSGMVSSATSMGVWLKLHRVAGAPAINTTVTMRGTGSSS